MEYHKYAYHRFRYNPITPLQQAPFKITSRLESNRAVGDEGRAELGHTMRKGELQVGDKELLDVWATEILGLLDLDDAEDLMKIISPRSHQLRNKVSVRGST